MLFKGSDTIQILNVGSAYPTKSFWKNYLAYLILYNTREWGNLTKRLSLGVGAGNGGKRTPFTCSGLTSPSSSVALVGFGVIFIWNLV